MPGRLVDYLCLLHRLSQAVELGNRRLGLRRAG
jgi:hypothetical protein